MQRLLRSLCCSRTLYTYSYHDAMKQRVRLAILECDTPLPQTGETYGGYGGVFKALLNSGAKAEGFSGVDDVLDISMHQIEQDSSCYPDIDSIDALLLTGSRKLLYLPKDNSANAD